MYQYAVHTRREHIMYSTVRTRLHLLVRAVSLRAMRDGEAEAERLALRLLTWPACVVAERSQDERRGVEMNWDKLRRGKLEVGRLRHRTEMNRTGRMRNGCTGDGGLLLLKRLLTQIILVEYNFFPRERLREKDSRVQLLSTRTS